MPAAEQDSLLESDETGVVRWLGSESRIVSSQKGASSAVTSLSDGSGIGCVWSLDERMRFVPKQIEPLAQCTKRRTLVVTLASGRQLAAVAGQALLKVEGWVAIEKLDIGSRIAIPRRIPEPDDVQSMPAAEVILLAHMIGDGSCIKRQPVRYASIDEQNLAAVVAGAEHFGVTAVRDEYPVARCVTLRLRSPERLTHGKRNPIAAWLDGLGLFGLRSYEKFVPAKVFALPNTQVALFVRHLWATDGSVRWDAKGHQARVYYATTSQRLADDLVQLLLRLGVHGRVKRVPKSGYRDCYHVTIDGAENQRLFLQDIGVHGQRGDHARRVLEELATVAPNTNVDTVPREVWTVVRQSLTRTGMTHRGFAAAMNTQFCGSTMWKHSPSRARLARIASVLDDPGLALLAGSDVFWDRIVGCVDVGMQDALAVRTTDPINLVANGVCTTPGD
ncbi:LAGLIDADG family homing endonuclease [Rhodococcus aetherivorans]|uniref:LAGLIDADG family homing endonuclease n=1 Tax=Rhodococcus aetherivorans TaxID=191292 RepID=UPI001E3F2175|nr:LAGLIDADG family homing endonuclease [Rhodococcus aetherivorans]UGQ41499.1 endonuclease [Rhodococcus aetherivorans]